MKKLTFALMVALSLNMKAGTIKNSESIKVDDLKTVAFVQSGINEITLEFPFAKSTVTKVSDGVIGNVVMIDYCYSNYQRAEVFSQNTIDVQRFDALYAKFPSLKNQNIKYRMIGQKANSIEEAGKLFHGFKIYYQPAPTKEEMAKQVDMLDELVLGKKSGTKNTCEALSKIENKKLSTFSEAAIESADGLIVYRLDGSSVVLSTNVITRPDSVVSAVFNRNKKWKNMVILTDVTGSMYPYIGQVFQWYKLNSMNKKVKDFYFFNDGDNKTVKETGKVGGIYHVKAMAFDSVYNKAKLAMYKGGGGDCPENNVETMILAEKKCGDSATYVMIADNWATPRDMELLSKVKHPVKVIVCGATMGINIEYINLALKTKGSIHTIEKDINNLATLHEGEKITVGKQTFQLKGGIFIELHGV